MTIEEFKGTLNECANFLYQVDDEHGCRVLDKLVKELEDDEFLKHRILKIINE